MTDDWRDFMQVFVVKLCWYSGTVPEELRNSMRQPLSG